MDKIQSQSKNLAVKRLICYVVLILLAFISLFPFYVMIINATRSHSQIQRGFSILPGKYLFKNFVNLAINKETGSGFWQNVIAKQQFSPVRNFAENYPILRSMLNSLFVGLSSSVLTVYFSCMTAYGVYMYNFKGKSFAFKFILAVMMVPAQVSTLGFIRLLMRLHLMGNYVALIVPAIAAPVVFFYIYQSLEATLPFSIVEAARVDGCNEFRSFNRIVIPMMKPALSVQMIFSFVGSWNNYFVPSLIIDKKSLWTVPLVINAARYADYVSFDMAIVYILLTLAVVPLIIIYLFLSKYIIGGTTAGGVKE